MADSINKEVIISITLNPSDLEKNGDAMTKALKKVKAEADELNKKLKDKNTGQAEREKIIDQLGELERQQKAWKKSIAENNKEIEFQTKLSKSQEGSNEQLRLALKKLTEQYNALGKEERDNSVEGQKLGSTIKGITDELKKNESAVGDNRRNVGNYKGALEETLAPLLKQKEALIAQTETLKKNQEEQKRFSVGGFGGNINATTEGVNNFNASLDETASSFEAVNQQIIANETAIANLDQEIAQTSIGFFNADGTIKGTTESSVKYTNTIEGMTQKLRDLKELAPTLDLNSEEFKKTNDEIRATQFEIDKAIGKVDEFGNKEPKNPAKEGFEDTFQAASALTSSIGLLTIAFGKNETIQEIQEKTLKAVAIAQTIANIATSKSAIIKTADLIQTKLKTAALVVQTVATRAATLATTTFAGALSAIGIGAIIAGIVLLATKTDALASIFGETSKEAKKLKEDQERLDKIQKDVVDTTSAEVSQYLILTQKLKEGNLTYNEKKAIVDKLNSQYGTTIKNLNDEAAILAQVEEGYKRIIAKIRDKIIIENSEAALKPIIEERINLELNNKQLEANKKQYEDINKNLKASQAFQKGQPEILKQIAENEVQLKKINQDLEISQSLLKANQDDLNEVIKGTGVDLLNVSSITDKATNKTATNTQDNLKAILAFEKKILEQTQDLRTETLADQEQKEIESLKLSQERQKAALIEEFNNLKEENDKEKAEKEIARQKLADRLKEIDEEAASKELDIVTKYNDLKEQKRQEDEQKKLDRQVIELEKNAKLRQLDVDATIKDERKKALATIQIQIDKQKELIRIAEESANLDLFITPEEQDKIDEAKIALAQLEQQVKDINAQPLSIIPKDFADKFKAVADEIAGVLTTLSNGVNAAFANATAEVEAQGQAQVKAIEKTTLTEKQKAKQIEKLNEDTAKKKYQLEVDAFNFNKGVQIAQAIISGAEALIANFAVPDPSLGIVSGIRAGIIIATTATQVGIIAGQQPPPPPFYEGGYTGDGDPRSESRALGTKDYIYHKGEYVVPNKILKTETGSKLVARLESMRLGKISNLGLSGFADGGFTANAIRTGVEAQVSAALLAGEVATALSKVTIVTKVTDINRVNKNLIQNKAAATLR